MAESGVLHDLAGGDVPSSFSDVVRIFSSHLASLHADPGRLDAVRESRTFRLCLHCIAHRISDCGYLIYYNTSGLKHHAELVRLGFVPPPSEDAIACVEKMISEAQVMKTELTGLLDLARRPFLRQDVDNVTRACKLNLEARRLVCLATDEKYSGRWDKVLRYIAESVNLLAERNESWPSWPDLDQTRQQILKPVTVYGNEDRDRETEWLVLVHLLDVSYNFLQPHAADVRKHVNFHSRYLDQEVAHMGRFIAELSDGSGLRLISRLIAAENADFCSMMIRSDFGVPVLAKFFTLRLYRLCLNVREWDLADTVMKISFMKNPDRQHLTDLLNQLLASLGSNANQPTNRIILNAEHDDGGASRLPELLPVMEESQQDEPQLRCVKEFQERNRNVQPAQKNPPVKPSASSSATTIKPSSSQLLRRERELIALRKDLALRSAPDPLSENRKVARIFTAANCIRDSDCNYNRFFYIQRTVENPVIMKFEGYSVQEIKTNIATGVPYHGRVLTYHPAQDEWSVTSNMCRISGPLAVELEGATCVPFVGDCGNWLCDDDSFVFKFRKSRTEYALREYMADARTQSTAAWYVNRFSKLTQDRFGILRMLHSDCVVVYQDSRRDTVLELMTREKMSRGATAIKFDKYTNNMSYRNRKVNTDLLEAFSHFTNHHTNEILMVTDLQGWVVWDQSRDNITYTLTDPVIHCLGQPYRFGETNRRYEGMAQFFQHVHPTCNHICEFLNLTRPEEFRVPENTQPDLTRREKPEKIRSLPKRVSSRPTNNPYKRPRLGSP